MDVIPESDAELEAPPEMDVDGQPTHETKQEEKEEEVEKVKVLSNVDVLCPHGQVDPQDAINVKRISSVSKSKCRSPGTR